MSLRAAPGSLKAWAHVLLAQLVLLAAACLPAPGASAGELVPMARVTIYPGDLITDEMLVDRRADRGVDVKAGVFTNREGLVGKVARATLVPEQPIPVNAVREPYVVKQGQATLVVFEQGALVISASAQSLQPGSPGDLISLRNTESGTTIRGVVQTDGTVRVGLP